MGANAQTEVPTFTASQVLTAAQLNNSARTGVPVFATTTTRDAAFGGAGEKTLAEGQLCYLEDSNVVQFYDGAAWKTVGPAAIAAFDQAKISTNQTTSSTSYTDLATVGPSVTLTTGTSAVCLWGCQYDDVGNLGNDGLMSVAVSGATTIAASDAWATFGSQGFGGEMKLPLNTSYKFTTLTAGSNTFTAKYRKSGGTSTAGFGERWLIVWVP